VVINKAPGPPFVCVHSIGGDALEFRELAGWLEPEVGFLGMHATLDSDIERTYSTIEATASAYLSDLKALQPVGPYFLGGWSSGGIVALEMAQQLRAAGEEVALLVSIDCGPGPLVRERSVRNIVRQLVNVPRWIRDDLMISRPADVLWRLRRKIAAGLRRGRAILLRTAEDYAPNVHDVLKFPERAKRWEAFVETHYQAVLKYVPRPYTGRVTLFKAQTHPLFWLHDSDVMWRRYAQDVEVHVVPGTHLTIARAPNARVLAEQLKGAIARAREAAEKGSHVASR
jgi:thioesterase domain-containing protein